LKWLALCDVRKRSFASHLSWVFGQREPTWNRQGCIASVIRGKREDAELSNCTVSIVVISHNEGVYLGRTVDSLLAALPSNAEIIVVDDCSTDGSTGGLQDDGIVRVLRPPKRLGTVKARNYGARQARGRVIVFSDAHVEVPQHWYEPLLAPLARRTVGAVGPTISMMNYPAGRGYGLRFRDAALNCDWGKLQGPNPYPVPLLGAGFFAMRRDVFAALGGFDPGMIMYGMEDPDLDIRLWTFGYECVLVPGVDVAHLFREDHPFQDWESLLHNILRYGTVHFGQDRLRRLIDCYSNDRTLPMALARVAASDAWARRREIQDARCHDDDWYFNKFQMS
jgi:glycosyltransferase involved in cell wall biosynthesis